MALVSYIPRLTLFYSKYSSSLYSVVLGSYMHELVIYPCYVDVLGLYARMLVVYPCYRSIGLYILMYASRPCFSTYFVCVYTFYSLVDLCYSIGLVAIFMVASAIDTMVRYGGVLLTMQAWYLDCLVSLDMSLPHGLLGVGGRW